MSEPVNLKKVFGKRFKVSRDLDMADVTLKDPWAFVVQGKRVCLYPHSSTLIAVEGMGGKGRLYRELMARGFTLWQDGEVEWAFHGTPEMFTDDLLGMMHLPKRRPPLTAEQREMAIERVRSYRFNAGAKDGAPPVKGA